MDSKSARSQLTDYYWIQKIGGIGGDVASAVVTDGAGNSYVAGRFSGIVNFGGTTLASSGTTDGYIAKYDRAGQLVWARQLGELRSAQINAMAISPGGDLYVAGQAIDTAVPFSSTTFVNHLVVARYDSAGIRGWTVKSRNRNAILGTGISVTPDGETVYVTGAAFDTMILGDARAGGSSTVLSSFVTRLDRSGKAFWIQRSKAGTLALQADSSFCITSDANNNLYFAGSYLDTINIGGIRLSGSRITPSSYLASYDSSGHARWAKTLGFLGSRPTAITRCADNFYITSSTSLITRFRSSGVVVRTVQNTGAPLGATGLASDGRAALFLTGNLTASLSLDTFRLSGIGSPGSYVLRLDTALNPRSALRISTTNALGSPAIAADTNGSRWLIASFVDSIRFGASVIGSNRHSVDGFLGCFLERILDFQIPSGPSFCPGDTLDIPVQVQGSWGLGNTFEAQLSDSLGRFVAPAIVGRASGGVTTVIHGRIPAVLHSGKQYRMRIVASSPGLTSVDNGSDLILRPLPVGRVSPNGEQSVCETDTLLLTASGGKFYYWSTGDTTRTLPVTMTGSYSVYVLGENGCGFSPPPVRVTQRLLPPTPGVIESAGLLRSTSPSGNQWFKDHRAIPGATDQSYAPTESGLYAVAVTDQFGCSSMSDDVQVTFASVSDASFRLEAKIQGPHLLVTGPLNELIQVSVVDVLGRPIVVTSVRGGDSPTILSHLLDGRSSGVRYIRISCRNHCVTLRCLNN